MKKILEKLPNKKFTIFLEGNIGWGKTTLLNKYLNVDNIHITPFHEYLEKFEELKRCNLSQLLYRVFMEYQCGNALCCY